MLWAAFIVVSSLCVLHDLWITRRRIRDWGPGIELNPITSLLCAKVGPPNGLVAAIIVPHLLWTIVAATRDWSTAYTLYTGWVAHLFLMQRASLAWEKELKKELGDRQNTPPPVSDDK